MANPTARALDTWINLLNKSHLVPVNAATFLRSVVAKNIGGPNFRPAPVTESNFTNAELDALLRLAKGKDGKFGPITYDSYADLFNYDYGNGEGRLEHYFTPLRSISTSAGQMGYDKTKNTLTDTYDFNRYKVYAKDMGGGVMSLFDSEMDDPKDGDLVRKEDLKKYLSSYLIRGNAYSNLRNNAHRFAHQDTDPDDGKIKFRVNIDKALKRLGKRIGTYDPNGAMSRKEFLTKAILAAGATGVPVGAALGALSGALTLINRKKRKHWLRQIALHSAVGAGIAGLAAGAAGGVVAHKLSNRFAQPFEKSSAVMTPEERKKRDRRLAAIANILAYGLPAAAVLGAGAYAGVKAKGIYDRLLENKGSGFGIDVVNV